MFRYLSLGQGSAPPVAEDLTPSSSEKLVVAVAVRVMPFVGLPAGSTVASLNSIRASAATAPNGAGAVLRSPFFCRKSSLSTSIWLCTWASEMFWALVLWTTCTTTGIRVQPVRPMIGLNAARWAWFSLATLASAYPGTVRSRR